MKRHFYHHIVNTDDIVIELETMELSEQEKTHLVALLHSSIHYTVLDAVLSELSDEDKKKFLEHSVSSEHGKTWQFLEEKVANAEDKITTAVEKLKKEFKKDIQELKEKEVET